MNQHTETTRSLFWPGFALGFLLLASVTCGGLFAALGLTELSLADLQVGGPAWTPQPIPPTPIGAESGETLAAESNPADDLFAVGDTATNVTNSRVNVRRTPGYLSKPADDVLAQLEPGATVTILGGVESADNLTWRRIRSRAASGDVTEGWVAEATASGVVILR